MELSVLPKKCFKCKKPFPATLQFFYKSKKTKDRLTTRCKKCFHIRNRKPPEGYKHCPVCDTDLPKTKQYFHTSKDRSDGLTAVCIECRLKKNRERYAEAKRQIKIRPATMTCSRCEEEKPALLKFFSINPLCKYGLNTICKTCTNKRKWELHKQHPEKNLEKWKRHYQVKGSLYCKERYKRLRESILAQQRAFFLAYPETVRGWKRKYELSPRGQIAKRVSSQNRRARVRLSPGSFTAKEIEDLRRKQKNKCKYCHKPLTKYHIDHVIPLARNGANSIENLVLACPHCNQSKGKKLLSEWKQAA